MALRGQRFQNVGAGGVGARLALLAALKAHLVEQDLAKLLRGADVELRPRQLVNLILQLRHLLTELV